MDGVAGDAARPFGGVVRLRRGALVVVWASTHGVDVVAAAGLPLVGSDGLTPDVGGARARVELLALFPSDAAIWLCGHAGLLLALVALVPPRCYIRSWHRAAAVDAVLFAALALLYTSAHLVLGKWQSHHADYITTQLGPATACLAIAWAAVPHEPRYAARVVALWRWQLFCIMLNCGIVKMNANWVECNQSLCDVPAFPRFWYSQERPTILGWLLAALLPDTLQRVFSWFTMWCELAMPFGYFVPSLWPICAAGTAALQLGIITAGHFRWFNLVCLVLTLSLVPPEILATAAYRLGLPGIDARVPLQRDAAAAAAASSGTLSRGATLGVALYVAAVYFASACLLLGGCSPPRWSTKSPKSPGLRLGFGLRQVDAFGAPRQPVRSLLEDDDGPPPHRLRGARRRSVARVRVLPAPRAHRRHQPQLALPPAREHVQRALRDTDALRVVRRGPAGVGVRDRAPPSAERRVDHVALRPQPIRRAALHRARSPRRRTASPRRSTSAPSSGAPRRSTGTARCSGAR